MADKPLRYAATAIFLFGAMLLAALGEWVPATVVMAAATIMAWSLIARDQAQQGEAPPDGPPEESAG